jgi:hypothetical protein
MPQANDGRHDFDFLHGDWTIHNRRLAERLRGCTEWRAFEARAACGPVLGGLGNVDDFRTTFPDGRPFEGMSLRLFNPSTGLWSIYWADDRGCQLLPPVTGRFTNGRGEFFGDDTHEGTPIQLVFHWDDTDTGTPRWSQSFSADGGSTWEKNWEMFFTRRESAS